MGLTNQQMERLAEAAYELNTSNAVGKGSYVPSWQYVSPSTRNAYLSIVRDLYQERSPAGSSQYEPPSKNSAVSTEFPMSTLGDRPTHCPWCGRTLAFYEAASHFTVWCENNSCSKHDFPYRFPPHVKEQESLKEAA